MKYNLESWKKTQWKGTKREQTTKTIRLVSRDKKGHFISVISEVKERTDSTGIYYVGYVHGKIKTRKLKERNVQHEMTPLKAERKGDIYRTSYVLNNVPISKNGYFGFRIVAFSTSKELLYSLKDKLKQKLIKFIEQCVKYHKDEFWFDMYFGYEAPTPNNALNTDIDKFYLTMENKVGMIIKEEYGEINRL